MGVGCGSSTIVVLSQAAIRLLAGGGSRAHAMTRTWLFNNVGYPAAVICVRSCMGVGCGSSIVVVLAVFQAMTRTWLHNHGPPGTNTIHHTYLVQSWGVVENTSVVISGRTVRWSLILFAGAYRCPDALGYTFGYFVIPTSSVQELIEQVEDDFLDFVDDPAVDPSEDDTDEEDTEEDEAYQGIFPSHSSPDPPPLTHKFTFTTSTLPVTPTPIPHQPVQASTVRLATTVMSGYPTPPSSTPPSSSMSPSMSYPSRTRKHSDAAGDGPSPTCSSTTVTSPFAIPPGTSASTPCSSPTSVSHQPPKRNHSNVDHNPPTQQNPSQKRTCIDGGSKQQRWVRPENPQSVQKRSKQRVSNNHARRRRNREAQRKDAFHATVSPTHRAHLARNAQIVRMDFDTGMILGYTSGYLGRERVDKKTKRLRQVYALDDLVGEHSKWKFKVLKADLQSMYVYDP
ncbi:hypothetical protein F5880DRAFT_1618591 [Lentinula raphanica]|nr:hypothetical protein F5880DRAFT_1618591 [Lentinula raphanica]